MFNKEKAIKLKEEGNFYYKVKNYKKAIESYTNGLKEKIDDDKELLSVLHSNRATAHFYLQNYRSALNDCVFSRKFNPKKWLLLPSFIHKASGTLDGLV